MQAALDQRKAAIEKRRQKRTKVQPWKVLAEEWQDQIKKNHGAATQVEWTAAEGALARKLLKTVDLDQALKMVRHFVGEWCPAHQKYPSFKLFWTLKDQVSAELRGELETKSAKLDRDEFDHEAAKNQPKIGWGSSSQDEPASRKREKLDRDEYSPEESKKFPKIGWA